MTGNGYGDGRAISIGELNHYEMQLKGAGKTPFHRGADGRAVLRSSIREFLASESMHYLGVRTTRALSLVKSETLKIPRPWYREATQSDESMFDANGSSASRLPDLNDPRLAEYNITQRRQILSQLRRQKMDPDVMRAETAAITCRVATSFVRIGHIDLFARRAERANMLHGDDDESPRYNSDSNEWKELEAIIWHAAYREYRDTAYTPFIESKNIEKAAQKLLEEAAQRLAEMTAGWIRVGFTQGNFNADNCLVSGCTMDYGPFGFLEEYDPLFAKWTGSGQHFAFLNQMSAGFANYGVLVQSVAPVIAAAQNLPNHDDLQQKILDESAELFEAEFAKVFRMKLGFEGDQDAGDSLWETLEPLMRQSRVDYTLLFRELSYLVRDTDLTKMTGDSLLQRLTQDNNPFYEPLADDLKSEWTNWLDSWSESLGSLTCPSDEIATRMLQTNPKYILREWMLVDAYTDAEKGQEAELFALYELIQRPYDEGSDHESKKYYRKTPDDISMKGGTAFMS